MERECLYCNQIFQPNYNKNKRYCSSKCRVKADYRRHIDSRLIQSRVSFKKRYKPCPVCGKFITPKAKACRDHTIWNRQGDKHPNWKGGRHKTVWGYIEIYHPDHPRAHSNGYVFEHILVWEQAHKKPLPDGWVIHHLNGIGDDNRPTNLVALPDKKHRRVLKVQARRIQELEVLLRGQGILI